MFAIGSTAGTTGEAFACNVEAIGIGNKFSLTGDRVDDGMTGKIGVKEEGKSDGFETGA